MKYIQIFEYFERSRDMVYFMQRQSYITNELWLTTYIYVWQIMKSCNLWHCLSMSDSKNYIITNKFVFVFCLKNNSEFIYIYNRLKRTFQKKYLCGYTSHHVTLLSPTGWVKKKGHDKVLLIFQLSMSLDKKHCTFSNSPIHAD